MYENIYIRYNIVQKVTDKRKGDAFTIDTFNQSVEKKFDTQSYWIDSMPLTCFPKLESNIHVDVAIVGGGLCGITTAVLLKQAGIDVCVIEAKTVAQRTTGHTSAKITSQHNLIYNTLISNFGMEKARQYAEANQAAIEKIKRLINKYNIDCDFSPQNAYVYTENENNITKLEKEVEAALKLGLPAHFTTQMYLPFSPKGGMCFTGQAQFHPRKYVVGLAKTLDHPNAIFEKTRVLDISEGTPHTLITENGKVTANQVIVTSHFPFINRNGLYFIKMHTERSYIIGLHTKQPRIQGMYISADNPTRSFRIQRTSEGDMVMLGGESHRTGNGKSTFPHYAALEHYAKILYKDPRILYRWSTQDCIPLDNVPYIGHYSDNTETLYVGTGFKKWGMTSATVAAMIISDLILKKENPWVDVFNSSRATPKASATQFVMQGAAVTANYVTRALTLPTKHVEDISYGEGKIVTHEGEKVGIYKDNEGKLHAVSPICTHMGCQLKWNDAEKSWDCSCHGSRFTYQGDVIESPTVKALETYDIEL